MHNKLLPTLIGIVIISAVGGLALWQKEKSEEQKLVQEMQQEEAALKQGEYSLADVAKHGTESDCWAAINGGVYNLTTWIPRHPGGKQAIIGLCGKDGSAAFNDQHGSGAQQQAILATFKVGTLK